MPKRSVRSNFLAKRKSLSDELCKKLSDEILCRFIDSGRLNDVTCVALYNAVNNEVQTTGIADYMLKQGKRLVYPRIRGTELDFFEITKLTDLTPGSFGVLEPRGENLVPVTELDLIVVPGVAFDMTGHRLGYGKGYYDRTLAACREDCNKVGIAFDFQVTDKLPILEHDQVLNLLVTDKRIIIFPPAEFHPVQAGNKIK